MNIPGVERRLSRHGPESAPGTVRNHRIDEPPTCTGVNHHLFNKVPGINSRIEATRPRAAIDLVALRHQADLLLMFEWFSFYKCRMQGWKGKDGRIRKVDVLDPTQQ